MVVAEEDERPKQIRNWKREMNAQHTLVQKSDVLFDIRMRTDNNKKKKIKL